LEQSRLDVLGQVRHLRTFASQDMRAGDLITGNFRMCTKRFVNYVARTDWIKSVGAQKGVNVIDVLTVDFSRDGWLVHKDSGPEHAVFSKSDSTVELIQYVSQSVVKGYVAGKCQEVGDSANDFVHRSADEYAK
jgi:hypothetical protein